MIRQAFLFCCGALFLASGLLQGCGTPVRDGQPVSITPTVVQVKVNDVTTITVSLSIARKKEGKLFIVIGDTSIVLPADEKTEIIVPPGRATVTFSLQGVKEGITTVTARMDNEGAVITPSQVVVTKQ